jgi:ABC-2 type transport system permease protein
MRIRPIYGVLERELLRMFRQRTRLVAAMVRPLIWLLVIGGGFAAFVGEARGVDYKSFLVPGVLGMTMLFGAMLAALTTVYDKESGVMRMMLIAPMPHAWIVIAKVVSAAAAALAATSLACAGIGMLTAAFSRSLDNFAGTMNFVIFPVFFLSGSLYPVRDLPPALGWIATANPYTYGVDLLKHALLPGAGSADFGIGLDLAVLALATAVTVAVASWRFSRESAYEPMIRVLAGRAK